MGTKSSSVKKNDLGHLSNMVEFKIQKKPIHIAEAQVAQAEAPELEYVNWWQDPGLRKLYFYAAIICVASATTGYDG